MNKQSLLYLSKILDEVSAHPVLRAKERMVAAHQRGGFEGLISATEKRIKATKDRDKLEGIEAALRELAAHDVDPEAKQKLNKLLAKVSEKMKSMAEAIAALDVTLSEAAMELREDILIEMLEKLHSEALSNIDESIEAFDEVLEAAASHAYAAGLFGTATLNEVTQALREELLEFLPALAKGAAAVGRGVGKAAKAAVTVAKGAHAVGKSFKAGLKQGYSGSSGDSSPKSGSKPAAKPLAKKILKKAATSKLSGAAAKLKRVGFKGGAKSAPKPAPGKVSAASKPAAKRPAASMAN